MEISLENLQGETGYNNSSGGNTLLPHLLEIITPITCFFLCAYINRDDGSPSFKRIEGETCSKFGMYSQLRDDFKERRCALAFLSIPILIKFLRGRYPFSDTMLAFGVMFVVYELVRALITVLYIHDESVVYLNAQVIVEIQTDLGMGTFERDLQQWALQTPTLVSFMNHFYKQTHWAVTSVVLCFFFTKRRNGFKFFRKWFILCNLFAFAYYVVFPLAPPRLCPQLEVIDTIREYGSYSQKALENGLVNRFAAMPSMHFGYSCLFAMAVIFLYPSRESIFNLENVRTPHEQVKYSVCILLVCLYPFLMFLSIIITGNHFVSDAVVDGTTSIHWIIPTYAMLCLPQSPEHYAFGSSLVKRHRNTFTNDRPSLREHNPAKKQCTPRKTAFNYENQLLSSQIVGEYEMFFICDISNFPRYIHPESGKTCVQLGLVCSCRKKKVHNGYFSNWVRSDCTRYVIDPNSGNVIFQTFVPNLGLDLELMSKIWEHQSKSVKSFKRYMTRCLGLASTSQCFGKTRGSLSSFVTSKQLSNYFKEHGRKTSEILSANSDHSNTALLIQID